MKFQFYNFPNLVYLLFFSLYFSPFLFHHSFAGNTDVIVHTSLFKEYILNIKEIFGGGPYGHSFYPIDGVSFFLENMYGQAALFIVGKIFFLPDSAATYFMIVVICVLNATAVNKVVYQYTFNKRAAFIFGLFFSASCYMLSNLEFLNGISFFPIAFAFYFLIRFFDEQKISFYYRSILFLVIQLFFSGYYFLLGGGFLLIFFLVKLQSEPTKIAYKHMLIAFGVVILFMTPTLLKLTNPELTSAYNPAQDGSFLLDRFTIKASSFLASMPRNLIYGKFQNHDLNAFRANNGILILFFFIVGLFSLIKQKYFLLMIGAIALVISFGSFSVSFFNISFPSLFKMLFSWNLLGNYFRLPYRFFTITLFVLTIFAALGYVAIENQLKHKVFFSIFVVLLLLIENIEYRVYTNDQSLILQIPKAYSNLHSDVKNEINTLADFPSSLFTGNTKELINNEYRREYIYMYWQSFHHQNIINGSASYFPVSRVINNERMINIDKNDNLSQLISQNQLDYIIFHKNLVYHPSEWEILTYFESSPLLKEQSRDENVIVYKTLAQ